MWARAAGGSTVAMLIVAVFFSGEAVAVLASWWLSYWSEHRSGWRSSSLQYRSCSHPHVCRTPSHAWFYLGVYVAINVALSVTYFAKEYYTRIKSLRASTLLFSGHTTRHDTYPD